MLKKKAGIRAGNKRKLPDAASNVLKKRAAMSSSARHYVRRGDNGSAITFIERKLIRVMRTLKSAYWQLRTYIHKYWKVDSTVRCRKAVEVYPDSAALAVNS